MIEIPFETIKSLIKKILGKSPICWHHRIRNPGEDAWKPCCLRRTVGIYRYYRCCQCGKEKEVTF